MFNILKEKIYNKKFNIILLILIIIFGVIPLVAKKIYFKNFFINNLNKENYFNALYGTSDIGCSTLNYVKPDILFIGDSMGYRAWDLNLFRKNSNLSVGACFLPSFTQHSLIEIINFIENKFTPKFIILSNNYRIFGLGPDNFEIVNRHKKFLTETDQSQYEQAFKLLFKKIRGKDFYKISLPIEDKIQNYIKNTNDKSFDKFVEIIIKKNIETSGIGTIKDAELALKEIRIINEYKSLKVFCDYINKNNINLILTDLPFSPPLNKLDLSKYFLNNKLVKNYFEKCILKKFKYKNNDNFYPKNKHFVFTDFRNIDFNIFEEVLTGKMIDKNIISYYDFDHMNRFGAKEFTNYWINSSENIFKNENK
jgi:hypothetical protein